MEKYTINYLGKKYSTTIKKNLSDEEYEEIKRQYYERPSFENVKKNFINLSKGGVLINHITNYYVKDLMAKTKIHYNRWSIEEVFNCKELVEFFAGRTEKNKKVFPETNSLEKNIETAMRIYGSGVASKPAQFPIKYVDLILSKYNINNKYYDFSCGWGSRLCSALRNKIEYYGTDPNYILCERLNLLANDYNSIIGTNIKVDIRSQGSEVYISEWENTIGVAFTSPPYFNLEDYKIGNQSYKNNMTYKEWLDSYYLPTFKNIYSYLIKGGYCLINIANFDKYNLIQDTLEIAKECGFNYIEKIKMDKIKRGIGVANRKKEKEEIQYDNFEYIYVFKKE